MSQLSGLQIFKYLPAAKKAEHTNCKECGCPTCMAFGLKLAKHQIEVDKCPYAPIELINLYNRNSIEPQKTIEICGVKVGGENVLYRHEKTFVNPTALAVVIDAKKSGWEEKLNKVLNFEVKRINEILRVDFVILKNFSGALPDRAILFEDFLKLPLKCIENTDFKSVSENLISIRKKAILEKDENYSDPVCVYFKHSDNLDILCAEASYYICKYANLLVFEDFDENLMTVLMTLRQSIFTDPQKPLQVESKLYEFNNPDENSIIFMTTNFALTYFAVANELESLSVPSYLLVIPADGMSVLTAWSAEKFTTKLVAKTIEKLDLRNKVKTRKIIIPGLLAHVKDELQEELKDFEIVVGTVNAYEISDYVKNMK